MQKQLHKLQLLPSYYEAAMKLPEAKRSEFITAIFCYGLAGDEPQFSDPLLAAMFELIKPNIDNSVEYYQAKSDAGKQGGRGKKKAEVSNQKQNKASQSTTKTQKSKTKTNQSEIKPDSSPSLSLSDSVMKGGAGENKPEARYHTLESVGEREIAKIATDYHVKPALVRDVLDTMRNKIAANPQKYHYENHYRALRTWVKNELNFGAKNASQLATPSLFQKIEDNPDLARQNQILACSPRTPASEADIAAMRAAMPEFIRRQHQAREKGNYD